MRILYRQNQSNRANEQRLSPFSDYGIRNCYFKAIDQSAGDGSSTKKRHSHTVYEFHMILEGAQSYETDCGLFTVKGGYFLAIPQGVCHSLTETQGPMAKYAITFSFDKRADLIFGGTDDRNCRLLPIPERVIENIRAIVSLSSRSVSSDALIVEGCVFECVILLLRAIGISESARGGADKELSAIEDERVELARQFISDNIEEPMQVSEVAAYCYISEKQLTRLFYASEGTSPAVYIRREKIKRIEELLREPSVSLSDISRRMGFPTESGFNAFF